VKNFGHIYIVTPPQIQLASLHEEGQWIMLLAVTGITVVWWVNISILQTRFWRTKSRAVLVTGLGDP
jgi:hypothetical protein